MLKDFVKMKNSKPLVDFIKENIMLESNFCNYFKMITIFNCLIYLVYTGPLRDVKHQLIHVGGLLGETNSNSLF